MSRRDPGHGGLWNAPEKRANVHKRYLIRVAGNYLALIIRRLLDDGVPREAATAFFAAFGIALLTEDELIIVVIVLVDRKLAVTVPITVAGGRRSETTSSTGC